MLPATTQIDASDTTESRRMRTPLWARIIVPLSLLYVIYGLVRAVVQIFTGVAI